MEPVPINSNRFSIFQNTIFDNYFEYVLVIIILFGIMRSLRRVVIISVLIVWIIWIAPSLRMGSVPAAMKMVRIALYGSAAGLAYSIIQRARGGFYDEN